MMMVVPLALISSRSSITLRAIWLSRLPVGSSASRSARRARERARDRDALLLAARELGGVVLHARCEAHLAQRLLDPLARAPRAEKPR